MTLLPGYPPELAHRIVEGQVYYAGNNSVTLALRGVHVKLTTRWEFESAPGGGDTHDAIAHGMRSTIAIRQQPGHRPELFVAAVDAADHTDVARDLTAKCADLAPDFKGLALEDRGTEIRLIIPDDLRSGHESHFAAVMDEYSRYFQTPRVPTWSSNLLAKYFITTKAVELAGKKHRGIRLIATLPASALGTVLHTNTFLPRRDQLHTREVRGTRIALPPQEGGIRDSAAPD